jgi:hypothetical protein
MKSLDELVSALTYGFLGFALALCWVLASCTGARSVLEPGMQCPDHVLSDPDDAGE